MSGMDQSIDHPCTARFGQSGQGASRIERDDPAIDETQQERSGLGLGDPVVMVESVVGFGNRKICYQNEIALVQRAIESIFGLLGLLCWKSGESRHWAHTNGANPSSSATSSGKNPGSKAEKTKELGVERGSPKRSSWRCSGMGPGQHWFNTVNRMRSRRLAEKDLRPNGTARKTTGSGPSSAD